MGKSILVTPERAEDFIAFIEQNFSIVTEFCNAVKDKLSDIGEKAPVDELKRMEEGETFTIANEETENAPTTEQGKSEDQDEETVTRSGRRRSFAKHVDEQVEDLPLEVEPERVDG